MRLVWHFQHGLNHPVVFINCVIPFLSRLFCIEVGLTDFHRSFLSLFLNEGGVFTCLWAPGKEAGPQQDFQRLLWLIAELLCSWPAGKCLCIYLFFNLIAFFSGLHLVLDLYDTGLLLSADRYMNFTQVMGKSRYSFPFPPSQSR